MTAAPRKSAPRKAIPANAPKPQDHKAKKSAAIRQAEADGYVDIEQNGITLRIPFGDAVPLEAYMKLKDGDELGGTEMLLGSEQWAAFLATSPTVGDFAAIGAKLLELSGE
jgi:hypothetical protein